MPDYGFYCLFKRIKIFHHNGSLYFKEMFDKLYQVSAVGTYLCGFVTENLLFFGLIIHASYSNRLTGNQNHQIGLVKLQNWASPWNP